MTWGERLKISAEGFLIFGFLRGEDAVKSIWIRKLRSKAEFSFSVEASFSGKADEGYFTGRSPMR